MRVILIYDIATDNQEDQNRLNTVRKIARKYLHHIQKSVFEGDITPSRLERLKKEILKIIDKDRDSVIIYILRDDVKLKREILTNTDDPLDTFI